MAALQQHSICRLWKQSSYVCVILQTAVTFHLFIYLFICFQILALQVTMYFSSTCPDLGLAIFDLTFLQVEAISNPYPSITSGQDDALLRCNTMNIFSVELTVGSKLKAAICI